MCHSGMLEFFLKESKVEVLVILHLANYSYGLLFGIYLIPWSAMLLAIGC
jgi:hypothetical protein